MGRGFPRLLLVGCALLVLGANAGTTHYVRMGSSAPAAPYTSWATAASTVQAAIDVAANGDEVWVAAGTYAETLTLASGVALYGGFTGEETALDQRNWSINQTLLDARQLGRVLTVATSANERTRSTASRSRVAISRAMAAGSTPRAPRRRGPPA
ncbi:MAG: hypothetical protein GX595_07030 [Lentisphaerae bacterium]|nr:hypothetical protein [Lentisphaerota bacterium]